MKTRKAISHRFKVTGTGKIKRNRPGRRHLLGGKTPKRKRQLRQPALVSVTMEKVYKRLMGV